MQCHIVRGMDDERFDEDDEMRDDAAWAKRFNREAKAYAAAALTTAMRMRRTSDAVEEMESSSALATTLQSMLDIEHMHPRIALIHVLSRATDAIEALADEVEIDPVEFLIELETAAATEDEA